MPGLPKDKKIVRVEYTLEDGSKYFLDEKNTENFHSNMKQAHTLQARSTRKRYFNFATVTWQAVNKEEKE